VITKDQFTEAEALRIFPEPECVEGSQVLAEHTGHVGWRSHRGSSGARTGRWCRPSDANGRSKEMPPKFTRCPKLCPRWARIEAHVGERIAGIYRVAEATC